MTASTEKIFNDFLENLKVDTTEKIASRRDEIIKALNKNFRDLTGSTDHQLMVGSYGRFTAVRGISDLDLLFLLPASLRDAYATDTGPRKVLNRVRDALQLRYPTTPVGVDQCVVRVEFTDFTFEVQPVFEKDDASFLYPDTIAKKWKTTKPRAEIAETAARDKRTSGNMRRLAKMTRAWRDDHGVVMGGLLIDTLVHRFFSETSDYDTATTASADEMVRDFFEYLKEQEDHTHYQALGSGQDVKVKKRFQPKAKKAYDLCLDAIAAEGTSSVNDKWRDVFGSAVPTAARALAAAANFRDTEEFIETSHRVEIKHTVTIDCRVYQNGFRIVWLRDLLAKKISLRPHTSLEFTIVDCDVPEPYDVKWKVLNRGPEAVRRTEVRGQIVGSSRPNTRLEHASFRGEHIVECFIVKSGVVVARDRIDVPIKPA